MLTKSEKRKLYPSYGKVYGDRKLNPSYGKVYGDRSIADRKYNATRRVTKYRSSPFLAWDGEGVNINNEHRYVLLMNSTGEKIINERGLGTEECLRFLCSVKEGSKKYIHVIYGGSYDVNMMLKDLSYRHISILQKKHKVFWKYFRIEYVPRKFFRVSLYDQNTPQNKMETKPLVSITLWDVVGFFQGTFVATLEDHFKTEQEHQELHLEEIKAGKARRSDFNKNELESFIIPYTTYELSALVRLMEKLRKDALTVNVHLKRWDGAGAAASAVLGNYKVKQHYGDLPTEIEHAAQVAYGGGRVEMFKYGHTSNPVYHYDIIGAYPSSMRFLPSLVGGVWEHRKSVNMLTKNFVVQPNTLYKIYWKFYNGKDAVKIFPFFYRKPWGLTRILYPDQGYSWVWSPELATAIKWFSALQGELYVLEAYSFHPKDENFHPFDFVPELYKKRLEMKKAGDGGQHVLKYAINSLYGKMAQTVGYRADIKHPPFYNLMYAGLITSYTRSRMYDAAMQNPEGIIAIATDGIWSTRPLELDIGIDLGQWEYELLSSFTSVQAGVYFAEKADGTKTYHYRGFNQGSIVEEQVLSAWERGEYEILVPTTRFVTMGTAVASEERFNKLWRTWDTTIRRLEIVPSPSQKRFTDKENFHFPHQELISTLSMSDVRFHRVKNLDDLSEQHMSKAHPLPWQEITLTEKEIEAKHLEEEVWEIIDSET